MSAAGSLLAAVPAAAVLLLTVAARPRSADAVAPLRLAVVRAVLLGGRTRYSSSRCSARCTR
ncbi:hypothetical protein NKG94_36865 [Micromonospora sp. M12]